MTFNQTSLFSCPYSYPWYFLGHCYVSLFLHLSIIFSNPGIVTRSSKQAINTKYEEFVAIKLEEDRIAKEKDNTSLISFPDPSDAVLYKHGYVTWIESDSMNVFRYWEFCKMYMLPRMQHCQERNECVLLYSNYSKVWINSIGLCNYSLYLQWMIISLIFATLMILSMINLCFLQNKFVQLSILSQLGVCATIFIWLLVYMLFGPLLASHWKLISKNQTFIETFNNNFLQERAAYLFKDPTITTTGDDCNSGNRLSMYQTKDINYNRNQMIGSQRFKYNWLLNLMLPFPNKTHAINYPLRVVDYMKLNKESVEKLLSLKNKVETKLNEKFIQQGFKVKQIDYMQLLDKIC